mmetsp:Transcript_5496/g.5637  ORF Transcript_5496/g.5637 Transcript_5496/m.5637 type:complete len:600 (+) Transcript_5496:989-2788(+)
MAGFQIPLELKINFLENIVIPSFDEDNTPQNKAARKAWMKEEAGDAYEPYLNHLIRAFSTITSKEEAEAKLKEAKLELERKEAKLELKEEREYQLRLQQLQSQQESKIDELRQSLAGLSLTVERMQVEKIQVVNNKHGVTSYANFAQGLKDRNQLIYKQEFQIWLQNSQDKWWPCEEVETFPDLYQKEAEHCQPFVSRMINTLALNNKHKPLKKNGEYSKNPASTQPSLNDVVDAFKSVSFNQRKPDIVMYKANQRGACSITMLGDVKSRNSNNDFPNEEVGHILDMTIELMTDHQSLRKTFYCFLTDGYRFQFFKCHRNGDSFTFEFSSVFLGESGWQIFFKLRDCSPDELGLVMDEVEGWSIINGLGTGRFSRVYEVKSYNIEDQSSYVLKYYTESPLEMGKLECSTLLQLQQVASENVPRVIQLVERLSYCALVVLPVGIPIIHASQNNRITSSMIGTLLNVLHQAHENYNIIHRDVKPENIFLNKNNLNQIILNDWGSATQANVLCPYQGTPLYGEQHIEGQFQLPTRQLDLHCLVKTVYTIKQQKYPLCRTDWASIAAYWEDVAIAFPTFQTLLDCADGCNYEELRRNFEGIWY